VSAPSASQDERRGECWDHVAFDAEHRLVLAVVVGKRTPENTRRLLAEVKRRLGARKPRLVTTDEYGCYPEAIREAFGEVVTPARTGLPGRPATPFRADPEGMTYATVHKTRRRGRVVRVESRVVFGAAASLSAALAASTASRAVNTSFVERHNLSDRHANARKGRKTLRISKDWDVHAAMTYFTMYSRNFTWPVRTLRTRDADGRRRPRTPAMAAGLTDHRWSLEEWLRRPAVQRG
jgi:IS1 family transposase